MSELRAVRCWCGELVVADNDEALVGELRAHADEEHPGEEHSDEEIRAHIAAHAEEAPDRPPWAY